MVDTSRWREKQQDVRNDAPTWASPPHLSDDPILSKTAFSLSRIFYPLGFAVEISTNSQEVLDAAALSWGHSRRRYPRELLRLRIGISGNGGEDCPPSPVIRGQGHLLSIVADAQHQCVCDLERGFAFAWLSAAALRHREYLCYHFIEAAALMLISARYVTPLHAACVSKTNCGLLLCGDSGAGKSSLAYACARSGWFFTSDDASYLLRESPKPRVVGNSRQIRFRPSARQLFPELDGRGITPRAEGKPSIEVPLSELCGLLPKDECQIHNIIFLDRQPSTAVELVARRPEFALQRLSRDLYPIDEIRVDQATALEQLSSLNVYELRYTTLADAVACLDRLARNQTEIPQ